MAKEQREQNDVWFSYRYDKDNQWRSRIQHLCFKHKYISGFPNFFLIMAYNDAFPNREGNIDYDQYIQIVNQESETVRKHTLTKEERHKMALEREHMETCQKTVLLLFKEASEAMTNTKKGQKWQAFYHEHFDWLTREEFGGFIQSSSRQGFTFYYSEWEKLIKEELRPGVDITKTQFYKELMNINDICLINRVASVDYFKNRNTGLLSKPSHLQNICDTLSVNEPFKEDPNLRKQCIDLYREMKANTVNDNHHLQFMNICNRVKSNVAKRSK